MKKILVFGMGNWIDIIKGAVERQLPSAQVIVVGEIEFQKNQEDFDVLILDDAYGYWFGCGWKRLQLLTEEQKQKTIIHSWENDFVQEAKQKGIDRYMDFRAKRFRELDAYVIEKLNLVFNL